MSDTSFSNTPADNPYAPGVRHLDLKPSTPDTRTPDKAARAAEIWQPRKIFRPSTNLQKKAKQAALPAGRPT